MTEINRVVGDIVPYLYQAVKDEHRMPLMANMAASNQCHVLTKGLIDALNAREIEARREYHKTPNDDPWHFVVAHTKYDAEPTEDDIITDLNPWQFKKSVAGHYTYLHAPRGEVIERLQKEGAPDYFIALRGLSTIVHSHTDKLLPVGGTSR
jgi:hypothetical protein